MKSFSRWTSRRQSTDGIPPTAIPAPRRAPIARHLTEDLNISEFVLAPLPPEDRNLLTAYPAAPAARGLLSALALAAVLQRPPCRILAVSAAFEYEAAVGQNLAMLADQDHVAVTQ